MNPQLNLQHRISIITIKSAVRRNDGCGGILLPQFADDGLGVPLELAELLDAARQALVVRVAVDLGPLLLLGPLRRRHLLVFGGQLVLELPRPVQEPLPRRRGAG